MITRDYLGNQKFIPQTLGIPDFQYNKSEKDEKSHEDIHGSTLLHTPESE